MPPARSGRSTARQAGGCARRLEQGQTGHTSLAGGQMRSTPQSPLEPAPAATRSSLVALLVLAAATLAVGCAPSGDRPAHGLGKGKVVCEVSGYGAFDPIVYPGLEAPVGHEHTFAGSRTILQTSQRNDADPKSLRGGSTSCSNPDDTAAYWFPTVAIGERPLEIRNVTAYYYSGSAERPRLAVPTEPYPPDLRLIVGRRDGSGISTPSGSAGQHRSDAEVRHTGRGPL